MSYEKRVKPDAVRISLGEGEEEIYALAMAHADRIYLTEIDREFEGDARFPEIGSSFSLVEVQQVAAEIPYTFNVYESRRS
jgi:dihydrofolate reductase